MRHHLLPQSFATFGLSFLLLFHTVRAWVLSCAGVLPTPYGTPPFYANTRDLCGGQHPPTVGCYCAAPGVLNCEVGGRGGGDVNTNRLYANFCYDNCVCYGGGGFSYVGNKENNPQTRAPPNGYASWDAYYNSALLAVEATCEHSPCSNHKGCSSDACWCDSTRMVGSNAWLFKSTCAGITALGKRDDTTVLQETACPCNCTYVSEACCHAPSGIVWPDPKFPQLGALARPDRASCCNTATGEFRPGPVGINGTNCKPAGTGRIDTGAQGINT